MHSVILAAGATGAGPANLALLALVFVAFYFILIRPQQKRAKAQKALIAALSVDDRVVTIGGIHGTVRALEEDVVHLELAPGTTITFSRQAIASRMVDAEPESTDGIGETGSTS